MTIGLNTRSREKPDLSSDDQTEPGRKVFEIRVRDIKKEYVSLRSCCFIYGKGQNF